MNDTFQARQSWSRYVLPDDAGKKVGGACRGRACRSVRLLGAWRGQLTLGSPSRNTRQGRHVLGRRGGRGTTGIAIPGHDEGRMKTDSAERQKAQEYRAGPDSSCRKGAIAAPRRQRKCASRCNPHALRTRPWLLAPVLQPTDSVGCNVVATKRRACGPHSFAQHLQSRQGCLRARAWRATDSGSRI